MNVHSHVCDGQKTVRGDLPGGKFRIAEYIRLLLPASENAVSVLVIPDLGESLNATRDGLF
jgi:hypothetical protein